MYWLKHCETKATKRILQWSLSLQELTLNDNDSPQNLQKIFYIDYTPLKATEW